MQLKADLQINEVMQSNVHGIMDDLNEYPDAWLELYNNSDQSVNLKDYAVSVKDAYKKAYRLPDRTVKPGEYVIVYCDKTDHAEFPDALMHADFRIDSGKGNVYLWKNGELAETLELKKMPAPDIAYGRQSETSDEWGYQAKPTPGAANCGQLVKDMLPDPVFGHKGGLLNAPVSLELSMPADAPAKAQLHYTLDGSVPDADSPVYTAPINIEESTVVRAVLTADGYMSPLPVTASFIFHPREQTLPVVSLTGDPDSFYGSKTGILVEGDYNPDKFNYLYDWRRPVNIEYFETDGTCPINQVIETRLKGVSSRQYPLRSMVLYANKRFNTKRLEYEFFHEQRPGVTDFKSLELRNAGNDFDEAYMRDALTQSLAATGSDIDYQAYQPVIFYLNGKYLGVINLRERANEDNIYTHYNGLEDIEMIETWWEIKAGDGSLYKAFQDFYSSDQKHTYAEYEELMDTREFADTFIANVIANNWDYPANNIVMWRPLEDGGRWRWIMKDTDDGFGIWGIGSDFQFFRYIYDRDYRPVDGAVGNKPVGTLLFRKLMETDEFRSMFIDRLSIAMATYMRPDILNEMIDLYAGRISTEIAAHRELYPSYTTLESRVDFIKKWYRDRVSFMYGHTASYWGLGQPKKLKITAPEETQAILSVNGHELATPSFIGKWYTDRKLEVKAACPEGKAVSKWRVYTRTGEEENSYEQEGKDFSTTFPHVDEMRIEPVIESTSIDETHLDAANAKAEYFDMQGRSLGHRMPAKGIFIRKAGDKVTKIAL